MGETSYFLARGGAGNPLLLHGFPETHLCWERVARELAGARAVIAPDHVFGAWPSHTDAIGPEHRAAYRDALTPSTIAAICADYRASFHLDRRHDAEDRAAGRRITAPMLPLTGADETRLADAPEVWRAWAEDLITTQVPGGHFTPEEAPEELAAILTTFLDQDEKAG